MTIKAQKRKPYVVKVVNPEGGAYLHDVATLAAAHLMIQRLEREGKQATLVEYPNVEDV